MAESARRRCVSTGAGVVDVSLLASGVACLLVGHPARLAHVVALGSGLPPPVELVDRARGGFDGLRAARHRRAPGGCHRERTASARWLSSDLKVLYGRQPLADAADCPRLYGVGRGWHRD